MAKGRKPQAAKASTAEPAPEPLGLNLAEVGAADAARHRDGVRVALGRRWGALRPAIVGQSAMMETIRQAQNAELKRYNEGRPSGELPAVDFGQLPPDAQRRAELVVALATLRGGGCGVLTWEEEGEGRSFDLETGDTEATQAAFTRAFASLDLKLSPWLVADILAGSRALEHVTDATLREAQKKGDACGLQRWLERGASQAGDLLAVLQSLGQQLKEGIAATVPKTPTGENREPRTS